MSTPRTKRQFAGASADPSQRHITSFFGSQTPEQAAAAAAAESAKLNSLPASVQSNLLSVGMRVRKSVPEGYKTAGPSAFKIWTDNTKPNSASSVPAMRACSRELLPFCGINKVGGLDVQPAFEYEEDEVPSLDEVPELTMSQDTVDGGPSRKRIYDDNDDEASDIMAFDEVTSRVMAVPRTRIHRNVTPLRMNRQARQTSGDDFEDAGFLVFDEEMSE